MVEESSSFSQSAFALTETNQEQQDQEMVDVNVGLDASKDFSFMQTLMVHTACVRSMATHIKGDFMMSGSIDMSNKLYLVDGETGRYDFQKEMKYHEGFVLSLLPTLSGEGFFSAGRDNKVFQIDIMGNPVCTYEGHEAAVNSMSQCFEDKLVTGSWDGTAKVWDVNTGECLETLEGHTHAVTVLAIPNGIIITGSQDGKIRMWYNGKQDKEFQAHQDIVRGFKEVPGVGFASVSNDETVKVWAMDGSLLMNLEGHTGFVFAIDVLETGEIVSGGDDCTVKIWHDGTCKQTIQMPRTVWAITHNRFGDLLVGCEDKSIRIFTRDDKRQVKDKEYEEYNEACKRGAQKQGGANGGSSEDFSKCADFELAQHVPGKQEGEIKVFKDKGVPKAYMWKAADSKWELIGDVIDPNTQQQDGLSMSVTKSYPGDQVFEAGEYDHVFDVDLGDGYHRKLPFNNGSNTLESAEKFIAREGLSRVNVEQIVGFLRQNAQSFPTRDLSNQANKQPEVSSKLSDKTCSVIPFTNTLYFDACKLDPAHKKVIEFNNSLNILDERDLGYFTTFMNTLSKTENYHSSDITPQQLEVLKKALEFPAEKVFPVLDIYRAFLMHPMSVSHYNGSDAGAYYIGLILSFLANPSAPKATQMLAIRTLCNLFKNQSCQYCALTRRQAILETTGKFLLHDDKNVRMATVTLFMNYSVNFHLKEDKEGRIQSLKALAPAFAHEKDPQNYLRLATTLGNVIYKSEEAAELLPSLGIKFNLAALQGADEKLVGSVKEVGNMLNLI